MSHACSQFFLPFLFFGRLFFIGVYRLFSSTFPSISVLVKPGALIVFCLITIFSSISTLFSLFSKGVPIMNSTLFVRRKLIAVNIFGSAFRVADGVLEFLVVQNNKTFDISSAKGFNFPTLGALIQHYQRNPIIDKQSDRQVNVCEVNNI